MKVQEIKKIGTRGTLFTFEFGDSVFLINGEHHIFLCDTCTSVDFMEVVKDYINENHLDEKPLIVFNSHSDWDHIWGNSAFKNERIISHALCRKRIIERAEYDIKVNAKEDIDIIYPNITFTELLSFEEDGVEFMYAPGHTIDSTICFDRKDKILYVGDLIEKPIPCLMHHDLSQYINTLEMLKEISAKIIVTTHSEIVPSDLIDEHIIYLKDVKRGKFLTFNSEYTPLLHARNLKNILLSQFDDRIRERLKEAFNFYQYRKDLWDFILNRTHLEAKRIGDLTHLSYYDFNHILEEYYEQTKNY